MYLTNSNYDKLQPDLWVSIVSDGTDAPEYDFKIDSMKRRAECYIESKAGNDVVIEWGNERFSETMVVRTFLDGEDNGFETIQPLSQGHVNGSWISESKLKAWRFAPVPFVGGARGSGKRKSNKTIDKLGAIEVQVFLAKDLKTISPEVGYSNSDEYNDNNYFIPIRSLPENSDKDGFHQIILQHRIKNSSRDAVTQTWENTSIPKKPYATFCFYYRPMSILEAILPKGFREKEYESTFGGTGTLRVKTEDNPVVLPDPSPSRNISPSNEVQEPELHKIVRARYYKAQIALQDYKNWKGTRKTGRESIKSAELKLGLARAHVAMLEYKVMKLKSSQKGSRKQGKQKALPSDVIDLTMDDDDE